MITFLLVACGVPESSDSASDGPFVSVAPVYLSRTFDYQTLLDSGDTLSESCGWVYLVNTGSEPVEVEAIATTKREDVNLDTGPKSWLDVSTGEDVGFVLQPGQQSEVELWALGRAWAGDIIERGIHTFDLTVTVDDEDTAIRTELILETAG